MLLSVERIKLFSTRSPWWTSALAIVLVTGMTALVAGTWDGPDESMPFAVTGFFTTFGLVVAMAMAAVAVTSEYRCGTIRTTFQAVPNRTAVLVAKTVVVAAFAGVVGLVAAFGAWLVAWLLQGGPSLAIDTVAEWRSLVGAGLVWAVAAIVAVAVGILVRHTAGAVTLLLVWVLLVESLVTLIPRIGDDVQRYMPFVNADHFLTAGIAEPGQEGPPVVIDMPFGPWGSLGYAAVIAIGLLAVALVVAHRRDA